MSVSRMVNSDFGIVNANKYGSVVSYNVDIEYTLVKDSIREEQASVRAQRGG